MTAYFLGKRFNALKLLRSHLEQLPIPVIPKEKQQFFIDKVNEMLASTGDITKIYKKVDDEVMKLYKLTPEQISVVKKFVAKKKLKLKEPS